MKDSTRQDMDHGVTDEWGKERKQIIKDRRDRLNFSDFFDRCHLICSEIGKFLPYKDESKLTKIIPKNK